MPNEPEPRLTPWMKYLSLRGLGIYTVDEITVTPETAVQAWARLKHLFNMG